MTSPIVFLDTETTSLRPDRRPWDIGMIRREPDGTERELTIFVTDIDLSGADLISLRIGHFYDRHPMYRKEIGGAFAAADIDDDDFVDENDAQELLGFDECVHPERRAAVLVERWTRGAHIVGAVPNFDTETLAAMLRRHGLCPAWHYHLIDVENLAVGWLAAGGIHRAEFSAEQVRAAIAPPWRSDDLARILGVEPPSEEERHTAMGDARWGMRIYDRISGGNPE